MLFAKGLIVGAAGSEGVGRERTSGKLLLRGGGGGAARVFSMISADSIKRAAPGEKGGVKFSEMRKRGKW